jgi:hypothetical protein
MIAQSVAITACSLLAGASLAMLAISVVLRRLSHELRGVELL